MFYLSPDGFVNIITSKIKFFERCAFKCASQVETKFIQEILLKILLNMTSALKSTTRDKLYFWWYALDKTTWRKIKHILLGFGTSKETWKRWYTHNLRQNTQDGEIQWKFEFLRILAFSTEIDGHHLGTRGIENLPTTFHFPTL